MMIIKHLVWFFGYLISLTFCLNFDELKINLLNLDQLFIKQGPNLELLQDYDSLLTNTINKNNNITDDEQSQLLPKVHYKKGIIDLYLGKDLKAINEFENCLKYNDNSIKNMVEPRLMELYLNHGNYEQLEELLKTSKNNNEKIINNYELIKESIKDSQSNSKSGKYGDCINDVSKAISISSANPQLYKIRIECSIRAGLNNEQQFYETEENKQKHEINLRKDLVSNLINDYLKLEQLNPLIIENYNNLANLYFYGLNEFENSVKHVRKGIHYDMDDINLKKQSLFFKRNEDLLKLLTKFKNYNSWLFKENSDLEIDDVNYINEKDYDLMLKYLFEDKPKIPKRDSRNYYNNKEFENNFKYLEFLNEQMNKDFFQNYTKKSGLLINGLLLNINEVACESYLFKKSTSAKEYCNKVLELSKINNDDPILPAKIFEIQKLIKSKNLEKLKPFYEFFQKNENLQKMEIFSKIYQKIDKLFVKHQQEEQYQRQQQQQQQQQQQRQYYQQQQQQQQRQSPPKNDYYKVLGVSKDASDRDIKTAYRRLVKQYHPDKYRGDDNPEEKMSEINSAYEVLSNAESRKRYDLGNDPNDQQSSPQGHSGNGNPFGGGNIKFDFGNGGSQFGGFDFGGFDFGGFDFGGFGGNSGPKAKKSKKKKN